MDTMEWVGHAGAFLSSITFLPQVYKTWKSRRVADLSMSMMLIVFTSTIVWLAYGLFNEKGILLPVVICNSIIMVLSALLIYFKISFSKDSSNQA